MSLHPNKCSKASPIMCADECQKTVLASLSSSNLRNSNFLTVPTKGRVMSHKRVFSSALSFSTPPSAMASAIEARYQRALQCIADRKSPDYIANKKRLQSILVQLEILMDRETPEQDKKLRMDIQMQSLASQFGKNPQDTPAKIRELCIEWYACPMCGSMVQIQLNERFASLLNSAANS